MDIGVPAKRMLVAAALVGIFALLLREHYILSARVDNPMSGDVRQYVAYAYNLVEHHVFSSSLPGSAAVIPDSYRGPGYPLVIAAAMALTGANSPDWYFIVLHAQAWLGAATAALTVVLGWRLRPAAGVMAGLLVAVWPMHITFTGVLLSEVWFGFLLALATLLSLHALRGSRLAAILAGSAWAVAFLVNPIALFLPIGFMVRLASTNRRHLGALLAGAFLTILSPWLFREATLDDVARHVPPRSIVNFVQGSWPLYHDAWVESRRDPYAREIMRQIDHEIETTDANPLRGLLEIADRIATEPKRYASWYLLTKPFLLWDWEIRIGSTGVFVVHTLESPFQRDGIWSKALAVLRSANPWIFLFAVFGALMACFRTKKADPTAMVLSLIFVYFTVVHVVFQAEPRYSVAYRYVEFLLAASFFAVLVPKFRDRVTRLSTPSD